MTGAIRRALSGPGAAIFCAALLGYAYFYQAGGWNQNSRFDLVRATVEQGTARIDAYHDNTGDKSKRGAHHYSDKAPGASWLGVPAYAAVRAAAPPDTSVQALLTGGSYAVTVTAVAIPSAAAVAALYWLLGALGLGAGARAAASLGYGLATLAFPYSTLYYGHQLTAALALLGFAVLVRTRRGGVARPATLAGAGVLLGYAIAVEYPTALAVVPACAYAAAFVRPARRLGWLAVGLAVPGIAVAAYHAVVFGGPLTLPYEFSTQPHRHQGFFMGLGVPSGDALAGILVSRYRGLLFSAPWLALAIPGLVVLARRGYRAEAAVCAVVPILFLWLNSSLVDWQGGWTMGPRYLIPAIPFLATGAAGLALARAPAAAGRAGWALAIILIAYAWLFMLAAAAVKPEVPVHIERPLSDYLLPRLAAGDLAVSTQSIDSISAPKGGPRHAWNLGQLLGLSGLASLVPLLAGWVGCGAWLARALRRAP